MLMTHMAAKTFLQPDGKTVLPHQGQDADGALGGEIERVRAESARKDAEIARLLAEIAAKDTEIERLRQENASLRSNLGEPKKTPRNSSIPPSRGEKADGGAKSARLRIPKSIESPCSVKLMLSAKALW